VKADYARHSSGDSPDRFDLGLGYEF